LVSNIINTKDRVDGMSNRLYIVNTNNKLRDITLIHDRIRIIDINLISCI